jgi:uridine kinase
MNLTENRSNTSVENDKVSLIFKIVDSVKTIIEEDKLQKQPLFLSISEQFILKLVKTIINAHKTTYLIGITGESASGKTTLVENAAKAFHKNSRDDLFTTICCDDYYHDMSEKLSAAGSYEKLFLNGFSLDTPNAINLELMKAHLISLKHNCGINAPYYDFVTCKSIPNKIYKKPASIVLNEGLYVLNPDVKDVHDIKVYVFTPFNIIQERWYRRAESRGKCGKAAEMQFADVNSTAQVYIRPTMQEADIVVNGLTSAEYIEKITSNFINAIKNIIISE